MNTRMLITGLALAAAAAVPAFAQGANPATAPITNNATVLGTVGPNSNSAGYPSAGSLGGELSTTQVGPQSRNFAAPVVPNTATGAPVTQ